jgi:hypothetical protein
MSIANELSGDIAVAILSAKSSTREKLIDLKETVIKVHYILQELDNGNLKARFNSNPSTDAGTLKDP